ncbi:serine/threonine protein kinase [Pirellula staleyi DSM 6068]|uniref:non-specific serine/threonine protein kinase n=1 Tax=Pirellula staleyi (strain ATCC 27377 / DSM 6068 / ICPB 4128) TaxID=530564 RepID=D2R6Z8_PIRSD|nr:protein kinase [Pirellula staleyi]ADB19201.1 serine/threonine protein kinase [Pirellula staleyi DSM 6068]
MIVSQHPSIERLVQFGQGRLEPAEAAVIESHLAECEACGRLLESVPDDTLIQLARDAQKQTLGMHMPTEQTATEPKSDTVPVQLLQHPRYEVTGGLGTGGMGAVYKAEHRMMQRTVALKVIRQNFIASKALVERFEREVRAAAKLSHPNIVAAYDAEEADGLHFLVMEYVDGISLDRLVKKRGPLAPHEAAQLIRQAATGLSHAHSHGMVHRDIKPQNLMVTKKGQLKILDFGLARLATSVGDESAAHDPTHEKNLAPGATRAGMVLGTPDYIAPEQVTDARAADVRSDLYALGCTLYFLLTGEPPFAGGSVVDKLSGHLSREVVAVSTKRNDVSVELAQIMGKLLAKNPADRFQTPSELVAALAPHVKQKTEPSVSKTTIPEQPAASEFANFAPIVSKELPMHATQERESTGTGMILAIAAAVIGGVLLLGIVAVAGLGMFAYTVDVVERPQPTPIVQGMTEQEAAHQQATQAESPPSSTSEGIPTASPTAASNSGTEETSAAPAASISSETQAAGDNSPGSIAAQKFASENTEPASASTSPAAAVSKNILVVLPRRGLWYGDFGPLADQLRKEGYTVTVASTAAGQAELLEGSEGSAVDIDLVLKDVDTTNYGAIVVAGFNVASMCDGADAKLVKGLLEKMNRESKPLVGICGGQRVLAYHGWLEGRTVAHSPIAAQDPKYNACGANFDHDLAVKVDGSILTARDDKAAAELGKRLAGYLAARQK